MPTPPDAHALLEALFTNAPVGMGFWDTDLRYRRTNATLAAMNGIAPDDHIGHRPSELLGELGREAEGQLSRVIDEGVALVGLDMAGETPASPGEVRHWQVSLYPVRGEEGDLLGAAAVVVEVTGERIARREEQAASALLDAVVGAAPVGIAFWDLDLRFRRVNAALAEMNGLPAEGHLGRRPDEVLGIAGKRVAELLHEVSRTGRPIVDRVVAFKPADGRPQFRHTTIFPVLDAHGAPAGLAGVDRDVTAQHDAEAERNRLLREALVARAAAEAAQARAEAAKAEAEAARRRTDLLARAGERLSLITRDYEITLEEVAHVVVPAMADWCMFTLVGPRGTLRSVAAAGSGPELERAVHELVHRTVARAGTSAGPAHVIATGRSELLEDVADDALGAMAADERHLHALARLGMASSLCVPLKVRGRTIGALSLVYAGSGRRYGADDLRLAESLAVRTALAVENARLYSERSHIAQTLQRSLLPPALPDVPGLELAARYRAAGDQNEVGGDFYDAFRAADGVWNVLIGDVSGKGAEAAALTSLTRHTLRAASLRTPDPIESLELLNDALWTQTGPMGRFCTVLSAQVRPDARGADVTLATGGHLPPVVLRAGGRVERMQVRGSIVGGLRAPTFGDRRLRLEHDDVLVLFTDGVVELRGPKGRFGDHGDRALETVLRERRGGSAEEVVAAVERQAVELQGGEPRDDIALVAVRPCS